MTPDEARKRVKECTGDTLSFHDVETLEEDTAEELAKFKGDLCFPALKTLSLDVAKKLVAPQDDAIGFFVEESDDVTPLLLPGGLRRTLFLDGLKEVSPELAEILATHNDRLSLNGIEQLSVEAATKLAAHTETLNLDGLSRLRVEVARALAAHRGELSFGALVSLADPDRPAAQDATALESQALRPIFYFLHENLHAEESLAEVLATFEARALHLDGLQTLDPRDAYSLCGWPEGVLSLNGLNTLQEGVAEALAGSEAGELHLQGLRSLSLDDIWAFHNAHHEDHQCDVNFGDGFVNEMSYEVHRVRQIYQGFLDEEDDDDFACRERPDNSWFVTNRPYRVRIRETSLTVDQATLLGEMSRGIWQRLGKPEVRFWALLELPQLAILPEDIAAELAKHLGRLSLKGLTELDVKSARALSQHEGDLFLNGLTTLVDEAARALATHKGGKLSLGGLTML